MGAPTITINLTIKGVNIKVSPDEAKRLYDELGSIFLPPSLFRNGAGDWVRAFMKTSPEDTKK